MVKVMGLLTDINWDINWDIIGIVFSIVAMLVGYYLFSLKSRRMNRFRKMIFKIRSDKNMASRNRKLHRQQLLLDDQYQRNKISDTQYMILKNLISETMANGRKAYLDRRLGHIPDNIHNLLSEQLEDGIITGEEFRVFRQTLDDTDDIDGRNKRKLKKMVKNWMKTDRDILVPDGDDRGRSLEEFAAQTHMVSPTGKNTPSSISPQAPVFIPPEPSPKNKRSSPAPTSTSDAISLFDIQISGGSQTPETSAPLKLKVISGDDGLVEVLKEKMEYRGCEVHVGDLGPMGGIAHIQEYVPDVVFYDIDDIADVGVVGDVGDVGDEGDVGGVGVFHQNLADHLERVKKNHPFSQLMVLTATPSFTLKRKVKKMGIFGVVKKPINIDVVDAELEKLKSTIRLSRKVCLE